jgi:hypothetical protein
MRTRSDFESSAQDREQQGVEDVSIRVGTRHYFRRPELRTA